MSETEVSTESQTANTDDLDAFSSNFFGQKEEDTSDKTKDKAEQEDESKDTTQETESQTEDTDQETEETEEVLEEAPKKKQTVQDRIDELVKQREDAKRDGQAQIDALRKEFDEQLKALKQPAKTEEKKGEPTPFDTKEDGEPKYPLGEFDPQYIRDLTRFTLEDERVQVKAQYEQEQRVREEQQAAQTLQTDWNQRVETAKAEYPDLVEKGTALLNGFNDLDQNYAGYLSTVLMSMDKGPDVLYYLSNHPEEARAIVNSGAQKATLALGRIEARFLETDQTKNAKPKVSKAPEPPSVRTRGTNGAFVSVAPDTDDLNAFETAFFTKK